jgi:hypothetical protein
VRHPPRVLNPLEVPQLLPSVPGVVALLLLRFLLLRGFQAAERRVELALLLRGGLTLPLFRLLIVLRRLLFLLLGVAGASGRVCRRLCSA